MKTHLSLLVAIVVACTLSGSARETDRAARCAALLDSADAKAGVTGEKAEYSNALVLWEKAHQVCQHAAVPPELRVRSTQRLASVLIERDQRGKVEGLYRSQLTALEQELGDASPKLLPLFPGLISALGEQGRFDEALLLARRAQGIAERAHGQNSEQAVNALLITGSLYEARGSRSQAESYYRNAIKNAEAIPCASTCETLALAYEYLRTLIRDDPSRQQEAEELSLRILEVQ